MGTFIKETKELLPDFFQKNALSPTHVEDFNDNYRLEICQLSILTNDQTIFDILYEICNIFLGAILIGLFQQIGQQNKRFHNSTLLHFTTRVARKQLQHKEYFFQQQCNVFHIKPEGSNDSKVNTFC